MFSRNLQHIFGPFHLAIILFITTLALGCGGEEPPAPVPQDFEFNLEVLVLDSSENPIAGVPVLLDENVVGFTGADGRFEGVLVEKPMTEITLGVQEIDGYRLATEGTKTVPLRVSESLSGGYNGIPVSMRSQMHSIRSNFVTWVELSCDEHLDDKYCSNRPILLDGEEIARTDYRGAVHFTFEEVPNKSVELTIATPRYDPNEEGSVLMEPRNPKFTLELGLDATIFQVQQTFTDPAARRASEQAASRPRPRRRPRPRPRPAPEPEPEPEEPSGPPSFFD